MDGLKIAFIGWNPFQFLQIKNIAKQLEFPYLLMDSRKDYLQEFSDDFFSEMAIPSLAWTSNKLFELDGVFDAIVCQTVFPGIERFKKTKIVMLQYGYAKESHNYGTWRALASANLVYGQYAYDKVAWMTSTFITGNPRYDDYVFQSDGEVQKNGENKLAGSVELDSKKRTILYAPTWGDLSSIDKYLDAIMELSDEYNILMKLHHNTDILEKGRNVSRSVSGVYFFGANDNMLDLLAISDLLISDYSGAIFDAVYFKKPVVLLNIDIDIAKHKKLDPYSIEISRREEIGVQVDRQADLGAAIIQAFDEHDDNGRSFAIRQELFLETRFAGSNCADAIKAAILNPCRTQAQTYLTETVSELFGSRAEVKRLRNELAAVKKQTS